MTRAKWTLVIAFIVCGLSAIALQQAEFAPDIAFDILGSATVPQFVAYSLLILVALMLIEEFGFGGPRIEFIEDDSSENSSEKDTVVQRWSAGYRTFAGLIVFLSYLLALEYTPIPFWLATFISTYLSSRILEGGLGRGKITSLIIAAIIAGGVEVIFTQFLLIDLP
jgi:hypothetical protein